MSLKPNKEVMQAAISVAGRNQTPFGAALAMGNEVFATAANQTSQKIDSTAHAEIEAIRKLSEQLQKEDLSGFILYTTCEPCPMCMSAVIWARIETVVYGCSIPIISNYLQQINIRADEIAAESPKQIEIIEDFMKDDCEALLKSYS